MIDPEKLNRILRPRILTLRAFWAMMVMGVFLFVFVAYGLTAPNRAEAPPVQSELRMVFYAIAVILAVAAYSVRRRTLSSQGLQSATSSEEDLRALATGRYEVTDEARLAEMKKLSPLELKAVSLSTLYFKALLFGSALHELIAICGMVLSMIEQRFDAILPFAAAAIVLNLLIYPRLDKFIEQNAVPAPRF